MWSRKTKTFLKPDAVVVIVIVEVVVAVVGVVVVVVVVVVGKTHSGISTTLALSSISVITSWMGLKWFSLIANC